MSWPDAAAAPPQAPQCEPGAHRCVALMLAFFEAMSGHVSDGDAARAAIKDCESKMQSR